ncbi:hypothetical protein CRI87_06805 [Liquorilactobacillus satsumensis]|uniref:DUF3290 family protein n=2 Tax=Liquorilactobacillus satsumensis TaxID=259059 RepID=UPI001E50BDC7|nr:DUF3290 family protein [Liquorilactobacillus satsumensis]MCC7666830.1 hypothetical protein [Liquorilactobacillus satsumensis]
MRLFYRKKMLENRHFLIGIFQHFTTVADIIVFLLLLFMLGLQYSDYTQAKNQHAQSFQMVTFITQIAQEKHVRKKTIFVNSTQLSDGIVVKLKNAYYRVNLNANQTDYTLTRTHLIDSQINIKK